VLSAIISSRSSSRMTCFLLRYFLTILVIRCILGFHSTS
jgi:hypothetical protein